MHYKLFIKRVPQQGFPVSLNFVSFIIHRTLKMLSDRPQWQKLPLARHSTPPWPSPSWLCWWPSSSTNLLLHSSLVLSVPSSTTPGGFWPQVVRQQFLYWKQIATLSPGSMLDYYIINWMSIAVFKWIFQTIFIYNCTNYYIYVPFMIFVFISF